MTSAEHSKPKKKWALWKIALAVIGGLFALSLLVNLFGDPPPTTTQTAAASGGGGSPAEVVPNDAGAAGEEAPIEPTAGLTGPQKNAVRSAKQYLSISGFSRDGLIEQLSSDAGDGYEVADATAAVDSLNVDWNENAAKSAKQYIDMTGFSCDGLIEQLSSSAGEKYTVSQATYGARQAGACS